MLNISSSVLLSPCIQSTHHQALPLAALSDHVPAASQSQCSRLRAGATLRANCPGVLVNVILLQVQSYYRCILLQAQFEAKEERGRR